MWVTSGNNGSSWIVFAPDDKSRSARDAIISLAVPVDVVPIIVSICILAARTGAEGPETAAADTGGSAGA
jgi:hypothetical protein